MRILQVAHHFLPRHQAGVEVHTDRVARGLAAAGEDVAVATTDDDPRWSPGRVREDVQDGLRVYRIAHPRIAREPEDTLGSAAGRQAFDAVLDRFRPDVVHFQHLMYVGLEAPQQARARGLPVVMTLHEYWLLCARGGQFLRADQVRCERAEPEVCARCLATFKFGRTPAEARIAGWCARVRSVTGWDPFPVLKRLREAPPRAAAAAGGVWPADPPQRILDFLDHRRMTVAGVVDAVDRFLAPSRFLMQKFLDAGWPAERIAFWPNGVPGSRRTAESPRERAGGGPLRVGFIGSLAPPKGLDVLLRAQARMPRGRVRVLVFGSGAARPAHAAALRRLAVPGEVEFRGSFPGGRSEAAFKEVDVLVVPSVWYENAPLVISEAQASGVPVVASRLGGMAEMVSDDVDGRLFEPGNPSDLARVLDTLAEDRTGLRRLAAGGRRPRSLAEDVDGLRDVYRRLGGGRR